MKIIKFISLFIAAALVSCSVDNTDQIEKSGDRMVDFDFSTSQMSRVTTDANFKSSFQEGDRVGVFVVKTGSNLLASGNYADNYALTYSGGNWVPDGEKLFFPIDGSSLDFYTYYPYREAINPLDVSFTVSDNQSDGTIYAENDFLYGKVTNKRNEGVSVLLSHLFALVNVEVVKGQFMPSFTSELGVKLLDCISTASINLSSGSVANSVDSRGDISMGRVETSGTKYNFRAIVPAQSLATSKKLFAFEQTSAGSQFKFEYTNPITVELVAANVEKWKITLSGDPIPAHIYAVGDVYPFTGTAMGIVFEISNGGENGKVVSLVEKQQRWGTSSKVEATDNVPLITSVDDGAAATRNLISVRKSGGNFAKDYAVFSWLYVEMNKEDLDGVWYMPAKQELMSLYAAMNGLSYAEIQHTWNDNQPMPGFDNPTNIAARTAFSGKIKTAGGVEIPSNGQYWASTEINANSVWSVKMDTGVLQNSKQKSDEWGRLRPILKF